MKPQPIVRTLLTLSAVKKGTKSRDNYELWELWQPPTFSKAAVLVEGAFNAMYRFLSAGPEQQTGTGVRWKGTAANWCGIYTLSQALWHTLRLWKAAPHIAVYAISTHLSPQSNLVNTSLRTAGRSSRSIPFPNPTVTEFYHRDNRTADPSQPPIAGHRPAPALPSRTRLSREMPVPAAPAHGWQPPLLAEGSFSNSPARSGSLAGWQLSAGGEPPESSLPSQTPAVPASPAGFATASAVPKRRPVRQPSCKLRRPPGKKGAAEWEKHAQSGLLRLDSLPPTSERKPHRAPLRQRVAGATAPTLPTPALRPPPRRPDQ